jgi:hypothetical protein
MRLGVQALDCTGKVATLKKDRVERTASEENSLPRNNSDDVNIFLVPFRQTSSHKGFLGGLGAFFVQK